MEVSEPQGECFVCQKHSGKIHLPGGIVYEDKLVIATHHIPDNEGISYLGWLLVEPKRHLPGLGEQTSEEAKTSGLVIARLSRALKACEGAEHVYAFVLGHHVSHLHVHLLPRYPGTPREYWGMRVPDWPDARRGEAPQIALVCARIRNYLARNP
jgi:histidine triad (HIT) family protein